MAKPAKSTEHPYIVFHADLCGGSPVIKGTRFPVRSVVNYVLRQGISPEELVKEFSHLTLCRFTTTIKISSTKTSKTTQPQQRQKSLAKRDFPNHLTSQICHLTTHSHRK